MASLTHTPDNNTKHRTWSGVICGDISVQSDDIWNDNNTRSA